MKVAKQVYNQIKAQIETGNSVLVLFDLDSTIFNVSHRSQAIINELCENQDFKAKFPDSVEKLQKLKLTYRDWGIFEALKKSKIEAPLEFFEIINKTWKKNFFINEYIKYDRVYDGVVDYVHQVQKTVTQLAYLTGRNRPFMGEGTEASLLQHGLPFTKEAVELFMKPEKGGIDELYKESVVRDFVGEFDHIWVFDNEPVILNHLEDKFSDIHLVYIDTVHSGKEEPNPKWLTIPEAQFSF